MPLRKHEPVPERMMFYSSPEYTICQVIRDIYFEADKLGYESIKLKARIATSMAKSMAAKLSEYHESWESGFFDDDEDVLQKRKEIREINHDPI
jgi:hypothetical protein